MSEHEQVSDEEERKAFDSARVEIVRDLRRNFPDPPVDEIDRQGLRIIAHIDGLRFKDLF